MKSTLLFGIAFLFSFFAFSQCMLETWSLDQRIHQSSLVLEGEVVNQECLWDTEHKNIYTVNKIKVFKTFKGTVALDTISLVTQGGAIGDHMLKVSPSLELNTGDVGVFLLKKSSVNLPSASVFYSSVASSHSFISYDMKLAKAFDIVSVYDDIEFSLYPDIQKSTKESFTTVSPFDPNINKVRIRALSPPTITSLSATQVNAGTSTLITINGNGFGTSRGTGRVGFRDADYGDGRLYYSPTGSVYELWSDTKIKLVVPTRAGTGRVRVENSSGDVAISTADLVVDWSHENVLWPANSPNGEFYETTVGTRNASRNIRMQFASNFRANPEAMNTFIRAMEEWRCETGIALGIGVNPTKEDIAEDSVNMVRFTSFGDNSRAATYSRYLSCSFSGGVRGWTIVELDMEFDSTVNWNYGTSLPTASQYDFESVVAHELGHGHQVAHSSDTNSLMYFALDSGERRPDLINTDIDAGNYTLVGNRTVRFCTPSPQILPISECTISSPKAEFVLNDDIICSADTVKVESTSEGDIQYYKWSFDDYEYIDSTMDGQSFSLVYGENDVVTIRLIVGSQKGEDTFSRVVDIQEDYNGSPVFTSGDTFCLGRRFHSITNTEGATGYIWNVSSGGRLAGDLLGRIEVEWKDTGDQSVSLALRGKCGIGPEVTQNIYIRPDPTPSFNEMYDGLTVSFVNTSIDADSYFWNFGDGRTSMDEDPIYTYNNKGTYRVTLSAAIRQCDPIFFSKSIDVGLGVGIREVEEDIAVYPNPISAGSRLMIEDSDFTWYSIYTLEGKLVQSGDLTVDAIWIDSLTKGTYTLTLQNSAKLSRVKVIVLE